MRHIFLCGIPVEDWSALIALLAGLAGSITWAVRAALKPLSDDIKELTDTLLKMRADVAIDHDKLNRVEERVDFHDRRLDAIEEEMRR